MEDAAEMVFIERIKVGKMIGNQERESLSKLAKRNGRKGKKKNPNSSSDGTDKGEAPAQLSPLKFEKS